MRFTFSVDAVDLNGAGVLGRLRLPTPEGAFAASWHNGVEYAGFAGIKDMQVSGGDLMLLLEGANGARHIGRLVGGQSIESCILLRRINRPFCLLIRGSTVLIGHVGGVSSLDLRRLDRSPTPVLASPDGRVVSMVEFGGRVVAAVQSPQREFTSLVDVETGSVFWSDDRDRLVSKLIVWQGRLVATDAYNAEIVVIEQGRSETHPLHYGYVRALCPLEDGSLLVARNVWRKHYRRYGERFRGRRLQPPWWKAASYVQQRSSDLLVVDAAGRIGTEIPFAHIAWEVSGAVPTASAFTAVPEEAAHLRAIHQRDAHDALVLSLRTQIRRLEEQLPEAEEQASEES